MSSRPLPLSTLDEALFELAPDAILLVDRHGRIIRANAQAELMFGYPRAEVVGQPVEMFVPDAARASHHRHRERYTEQPRTRPMAKDLQLSARRKDGSELPVEIALAPVPLPEGSGVVAIIRDVSVRRVAEQTLRDAHDELERRVAERTRELSDANRRLSEEHTKLVQAEKMSSIGLLAAGVAHEINNPLSGVMGLVKAIRDGAVPEGKRPEYFETVDDGLERIRLTVQGLLDFSRPRAPSWTAVDTDDMVAACLRLIMPATRKKNLAVEHRPDGDGALGPSWVRADRSQLMQAVVNVLMNAIHAAPTGSEVTVVTRRADRRVAIAIIDRGSGIPPEMLNRIYDPFYTTKPEGEGTGLGLAITLGIIHNHGGELAVDSGPDRGTTMTLWLPMAPSEEY
jgi:PAS domain S-box-containing protein